MLRLLPVAIAFAAIAAWPALLLIAPGGRSDAAGAPVHRDYLDRDRTIAFYERESSADHEDQIALRMLAAQYLQRFRERGDLGDVERAKITSRRSLALQPYGNDAADATLASALLAYHEFTEALHYQRDALAAVPTNDDTRAQIASLLMELGRYDEAGGVLARPPQDPSPSWRAVAARYDELHGRMSLARNEIREAEATVDGMLTVPAYTRSWYHVRAAQLAFEDGDDGTVGAEIAQALRVFPDNAGALLVEAQWHRSHARWREALTAATRSAELYPLPQALGYEADAQRALGDEREAAATDGLIDAEQRLNNAQGVNDRLLAAYYAQRHAHLEDALRFARADLIKRGDEIYADDTVAWVLASMGRWTEAYRYSRRATRLGTNDPVLLYHAGTIAMEAGNVPEGRRLVEAALRQNPSFDPFGAEDARRRLHG
ncbi:MAG TPA: tetratricopeptide repeat protein [Candidatus Baltobacteraceae bacterium]|nr:tetratricopeptide repeat protein [Candidatus Baltobacteraceae bacterium]